MITEATSMTTTLTDQSNWLVTANNAMVADAAAAMARIGLIREPQRSDHIPAATRPSAPTSCATVTITLAAPMLQPLSVTSHTSVKVHTTT
ncbi:Uncharacterised protein [Mycobacteroides abscessus subsp. abscessus]|nr:Uncharacterised protein [Mycobacteroides abscessus subsp. abscessus]